MVLEPGDLTPPDAVVVSASAGAWALTPGGAMPTFPASAAAANGPGRPVALALRLPLTHGGRQ
jgi:hypothetical protein